MNLINKKAKKRVKNICFLIAMKGEASNLISELKLDKNTGIFPIFVPMELYLGRYQNLNISIVLNGKDKVNDIDNIATQPAVLSSYLAIEHLKPDLLINAGTAGGFKEKGLEIGDVVVAQGKAWFHDRRIAIAKFREYGLGGYILPDWTQLIEALNLKKAIISSGNSFDFNKDDKAIMAEKNASIKDMEAASVAWMTSLSGTPLIILKSVTDFVNLENNNEVEFGANFKKSVENLTSSCLNILDFFAKKE